LTAAFNGFDYRATADYSYKEMYAALDVSIPNYASAVVATNEIVDSISALENLGICARAGSFVKQGADETIWTDDEIY
jgi:hypothetical protein